jgi:putative ABC transport system permease protein
VEFLGLSTSVALAAFGAGVVAAYLVVTQTYEFPFAPDWRSLALIPMGAILLAVAAAFIAAIPALNARPAAGLRAL